MTRIISADKPAKAQHLIEWFRACGGDGGIGTVAVTKSLFTVAAAQVGFMRDRIDSLEEALRVSQWGAFRHTPTGRGFDGRESRFCPACMGICPEDPHPDWKTYGHHAGCPIAVALNPETNRE